MTTPEPSTPIRADSHDLNTCANGKIDQGTTDSIANLKGAE